MRFNKSALWVTFLLSVVLFFLSKNMGMFWDNVMFASRMGKYLYQNGLFQWLFPNEIDPGHPPFLAVLMTIGWKLLGKDLWVSHLLMLPFVFGFLYQLFVFITNFFEKPVHQWLTFILVVLNPSLSAELIIISPEVIQLFFFFWAINAFYKKNHVAKTIALAFLGIVFYRGMMLCAGLFLYEAAVILWVRKQSFKNLLNEKNIISYAVGAIPAVSYVIWRLATKGWLQSHPDSPWVACWQMATVTDFLRNLFVLAHRFGDFGRIFLILFIIYSFIKFKNSLKNKKIQLLICLAIFPVLIVSLVSLFSTNAFGHRYFIVAFIAFALLTYRLILDYYKYKKLLYTLFLLFMITGNLWVYPTHIAQGWSASLAHIPYFKLRHQAIEYMDINCIPVEKTATFFPNIASIDDVDLNEDHRKFQSFDGSQYFVLYSNVYNLSDIDLILIKKNYHSIKTFKKYPVEIIIFEKNK